MLVRLYALSGAQRYYDRAEGHGVVVRRATPSDLTPLRAFVDAEFGARWGDGVAVAFSRQPIAAFVAHRDEDLTGFAMYDVAYRMYFGPMGVREHLRWRGVGAALLLRSLEAMSALGYAYAIIGDVGPSEFYEKVCGATMIGGSQRPSGEP